MFPQKLISLAVHTRHQLQQIFSSNEPNHVPAIEVLETVSSLISEHLENKSLSQNLIASTKLIRIWNEVLKKDAIGGNEQFGLHVRLERLVARYQAMRNDPLISVSKPHNETDIAKDGKHDINLFPGLCIVQITPEQCAELTEKAAQFTPPLS